MKLDALIAFTQASYRTLQVSLLNMIKTNKRIRILKLHVVCLTFEILFTTILHFFNI